MDKETRSYVPFSNFQSIQFCLMLLKHSIRLDINMQKTISVKYIFGFQLYPSWSLAKFRWWFWFICKFTYLSSDFNIGIDIHRILWRIGSRSEPECYDELIINSTTKISCIGPNHTIKYLENTFNDEIVFDESKVLQTLRNQIERLVSNPTQFNILHDYMTTGPQWFFHSNKRHCLNYHRSWSMTKFWSAHLRKSFKFLIQRPMRWSIQTVKSKDLA